MSTQKVKRPRIVAPSSKFPPNPHFDENPTFVAETAAPSSISSTATGPTQKALRNRLLRLAQFCTVTGSARVTNQAAHVLNIVRKRKDETVEDTRSRKRAIESFLTDLCIVGNEPFLLDSIFNVFLLAMELQYAWDSYACILFCPSVQRIQELSVWYQTCNYIWQGRATADGVIPPKRLLASGGQNLLFSTELDIFVLHARTLLPHGHPLSVCINPPHLNEDNPAITTPSTWVEYHFDAATSQLVWNGTPSNLTIWHGKLSTVAMILNADAKLEHACAGGWELPPNVLALKEAINQFKTHFFFTPHLESKRHHNRNVSDNSDTTKNGRDTPKGSDQDIVMGGEGMGSKASGSGYVHEELDEEDNDEVSRSYEEFDEDDEEDEEDEDWRTLPIAEFNLGLKKVRDPSTSLQDRIEIASLLLHKRHLPLP
ncbi:hypothetical protein C8J57DRAFT_1360389, partial [Mycena rebaudengoi]